MALATGVYPAIILYSQVIGKVEKFFFVLTDTGERGEAVMMVNDKHGRLAVALAGELGLPHKGVQLPGDTPDLPVVKLSLRFEPRFDSNKIVSARATGERMLCDIRRKPAPTFEHVEF